EWEAFKKVISRRNIRRRITIPLTLSNLKLLRRITRTENILHRNFTRRQVAIQNRVASNIGISQSTFSVKVLNLDRKSGSAGMPNRSSDLSLRSSRSSYFATFRHQLTILSKTDALDEEKWLNMLGTFVKDWFRYESHFVHGRDSLVDILKERGLLSESDAVQ